MQIMPTRGHFARLRPAAFALVAALALAVPAAAAESADQFLKRYGEEALAELTAPGLSEEDLAERFAELLDEGFDVPAIGQFVVARYWRSADEEQRREFLAVFRDYLTQRFLPLFRDYEGQGFDTQRPKPTDHEDLVWVPLHLSTGGDSVRTEWLLRNEDGGYKIVDIKAEGTSMAITLRDEYASVIRREGGIEGLTSEIRRLLEQGAFKPKS